MRRSPHQGASPLSPWMPVKGSTVGSETAEPDPKRTALLAAALIRHLPGKTTAAEAQVSWNVLIAGYLYLGGLGAGAFIVTVFSEWMGLTLTPTHVDGASAWSWDWSKILVLWGPFATALGASLLVFHLGRNWRRAATACLNLRTAWMARGFIILAAFILVGGSIALITATAPAWAEHSGRLWRPIQGVGVALAFGTAVYTGILLRSIKFIPAWNSAFLPWLFLASALSTGAMALALGATACGSLLYKSATTRPLTHHLELVELGLLIGEAILLALYVHGLRHGTKVTAMSARIWLSGPRKLGFWLGVVGLALAVPFALGLVNLRVHSPIVETAAAGCVLVGGFALRSGVLGIGVKDTPPLCGLAEWIARSPTLTTSGRMLTKAPE